MTLSILNRSHAELTELRRRYLNPTLSLAYQQPLKIVRGEGAYLYEQDGRAFLDMVNNVCHVGHCHPRVVAAGQAQMALLNTNTRYLHDNLVNYALRLQQYFPAELSVVFPTNSGTEANDLALRLARAYTGAHDVIVIDHAYHGHSPSMIELSPYKFNGQGGNGRAAHVQVVAMPDTFRGPYRDELAAQSYANQLDIALAQIQQRGSGAAVFYAESMLGCGGQIILPPGYLQQAYQKVRAAGALCLADEVQVGFGRAGSEFWAFATQGVVPDIVTLGKPIANGHPMGAVITRPEIAAAFVNGMEYFNTFAGNPVSSAIAMAVLDVIEDESLQSHAEKVGQIVLEGLRGLQKEFPEIADVRGQGLFIGAEIMRENQADARLAKAIVEALKHKQILLSTDGPEDNVLKIKPPMVFSAAHADEFLEQLRVCLRQLR